MIKKRPRGRPPTGSALSAADRMRRMRERRRAEGLKPVVAWVRAEPEFPAAYSSHRLFEARSLAMHAVIARKIERNPALLQVARDNVERWSGQRRADVPAWLDEWRAILQQPWQNVVALITEPSEDAARLRQSSPFAGILTNQERWRIHEAFRA